MSLCNSSLSTTIPIPQGACTARLCLCAIWTSMSKCMLNVLQSEARTRPEFASFKHWQLAPSLAEKD